MVVVLGAPKRNVDFAESGFTGQTSCIFFRYSAIGSGLRSENRFRFHGNAANVNRI
jgi:hypothetical protein